VKHVPDRRSFDPIEARGTQLRVNGYIKVYSHLCWKEKKAMRKNTRTLLVIICSCLLTSAAVAQVEVNPVDVKGKIINLNPTVITILTDEGKQLNADISNVRSIPGGGILDMPPPTFKTEGVQSTDALRKGMYVRFETNVERLRFAPDQVDALTVFTATPFTPLGFMDPQLLAIDELELAEDKGDAKAAAGERFQVAGILDEFRGDKITVLVPHQGESRSLKVKLSKETIVSFELNDLTMAKVGARVHAKGDAIRLPNFFASEITMTLVPDEKIAAVLKKREVELAAEDKDNVAAADGLPAEKMEDKRKAAPAVNAIAKDDVAKNDVAAAKEKAEADEFKNRPREPLKVAAAGEDDAKNADGRRRRGKASHVIKIN
jgi:hypothetical protein